MCIARQCVLQSFVIQETALHKNTTSQVQLIWKKLTCSSLQRTWSVWDTLFQRYKLHTNRSNSRSIPALVLPFSADHRASGSRSNPLRVRQRTACNYWRLTHSLIFLISSVKSPSSHDEKKRVAANQVTWWKRRPAAKQRGQRAHHCYFKIVFTLILYHVQIASSVAMRHQTRKNQS